MVQPKDSTAPLSWRNAGAVMEGNRASIQEELAFNDQTVYSYQQINCLDSVIRYTWVEVLLRHYIFCHLVVKIILQAANLHVLVTQSRAMPIT